MGAPAPRRTFGPPVGKKYFLFNYVDYINPPPCRGDNGRHTMTLEISSLLDLSHTLAGSYLAGFRFPWEALDGIKDLILSLGPTLSPEIGRAHV